MLKEEIGEKQIILNLRQWNRSDLRAFMEKMIIVGKFQVF